MEFDPSPSITGFSSCENEVQKGSVLRLKEAMKLIFEIEKAKSLVSTTVTGVETCWRKWMEERAGQSCAYLFLATTSKSHIERVDLHSSTQKLFEEAQGNASTQLPFLLRASACLSLTAELLFIWWDAICSQRKSTDTVRPTAYASPPRER